MQFASQESALTGITINPVATPLGAGNATARSSTSAADASPAADASSPQVTAVVEEQKPASEKADESVTAANDSASTSAQESGQDAAPQAVAGSASQAGEDTPAEKQSLFGLFAQGSSAEQNGVRTATAAPAAKEAAPVETAAESGPTGTVKEQTVKEEVAAADQDAQPARTQTAPQASAQSTGDSLTAQKRSFLSAFFSPAPKEPAPFANAVAAPAPRAAAAEQKESENNAQSSSASAAAAKEAADSPRLAMVAGEALPGVRATDQLFEIKFKSGLYDESNVDVHEYEEGLYQVAAAAGLARLAPNGLLKQHEKVEVSCFKPALVHLLRTIERRYGKKILVTSGYRSPEHNRRVRGAPKSMHMACAAADIQVAGVSKWELARFVRSLPDRGGVGTYCHTESVHVDIGPERDWNWRCRRAR